MRNDRPAKPRRRSWPRDALASMHSPTMDGPLASPRLPYCFLISSFSLLFREDGSPENASDASLLLQRFHYWRGLATCNMHTLQVREGRGTEMMQANGGGGRGGKRASGVRIKGVYRVVSSRYDAIKEKKGRERGGRFLPPCTTRPDPKTRNRQPRDVPSTTTPPLPLPLPPPSSSPPPSRLQRAALATAPSPPPPLRPSPFLHTQKGPLGVGPRGTLPPPPVSQPRPRNLSDFF